MLRIISLILSFLLLPLAQAENLSVPWAGNYKVLSLKQLRAMPRYIMVIESKICISAFDDNDYKRIPYLKNRAYEKVITEVDSAESMLMIAFETADLDILKEGLKEYPNFLKYTIQATRDECGWVGENKLHTISALITASNRGSNIAKNFLALYKKKLGKKKYNAYLKYIHRMYGVSLKK